MATAKMHLSTLFVALSSVILISTIKAQTVEPDNICHQKMDLVFLADKSGSISGPQFRIEKAFMANVSALMDVNDGRTHVAMALFSSHFHLKWCFYEYTDKDDLVAAESDMMCPECERGLTVTGDAMKAVREQVLQPACGVRSKTEVPRVVVVITDGKSTEKPHNGYSKTWLQEQADLLRSGGNAHVIAIGVGENFDVEGSEENDELHKIADDAGKVFATDDLHKLVDLFIDVSNTVCETAADCYDITPICAEYHAKLKATITYQNETHEVFCQRPWPKLNCRLFCGACTVDQNSEVCANRMDLIFLVDKSGSIKKWQFYLAKKFMAQVVDKLDVGDGDTHVAMALYGNEFQKKWCFDEYTDKSVLMQKIKDVECPNCGRGKTVTGEAMRLTRTNMLVDPSCGARDATVVPRVVVIITDGKATESPTTVKDQANLLRLQGHARVVAIGVGSKFETASGAAELLAIAGNEENVFTTAGYSKLLELLHEVSDRVCNISEPVDTSVPTVPPTLPPTVCQIPMDVVVLLDKSGSISDEDWQSEKDYIRDVMRRISYGNDKALVALTVFDEQPHLKWCFDKYTTHEQLDEALEAVTCSQCTKGKTGMVATLKFAREFMLTSKCNVRPPDVPKVVIVFTDARITDDWRDFVNEAEALKNVTNTFVLAVAVGRSRQKPLKKIVSRPDFAHKIGNLDGFMTGVEEFCEKRLQVCNAPADIHFLLDASGSMKKHNFYKQLIFVWRFIKTFEIGPDDVRIGLTTFSNNAKTVFGFNTYDNKEDLFKALYVTPYEAGETETHLGLQLVREKAFTVANGMRPHAPNVLVVFTDGKANDGDLLKEEADLLQKTDIKVLVIGIGDKVDPAELNMIAGNITTNVMVAYNFDALISVLARLKKETCTVVGNTTPDPHVTPAPVNWIVKGAKEYTVLPNHVTSFNAAKQLCTDIGARLPEPHNNQENDDLASLGSEWFYLGFTDSKTEGQWISDSSGSNITFVNWMEWAAIRNEPNGYKIENCVVMIKNYPTMRLEVSPASWLDIPCSLTGAYTKEHKSDVICEKGG